MAIGVVECALYFHMNSASLSAHLKSIQDKTVTEA